MNSDNISPPAPSDIMGRYRSLLTSVDGWFNRCIAASEGEIVCRPGCSDCCRGLFDITLLDAFFLRHGFAGLDPELRNRLSIEAQKRLASLRNVWPDLAAPYVLNIRPEEEWDALMPDEDETPCLLLDDNGGCLLYDYRPMTCRLHGAPLVDISGEVMHDEWCTMNFRNEDPLSHLELRGEFEHIFRDEVSIFRDLMALLFKQRLNELDTFIPLALLIDFDQFDWPGWLQEVTLVENPPV